MKPGGRGGIFKKQTKNGINLRFSLESCKVASGGGAVFHCGCFGANIDNDADCFLWPGILCGSNKKHHQSGNGCLCF